MENNADAWRDPNPWTPMSNPLDLKHLGKLLEELGECVEVSSAMSRSKLQDEMADVKANIFLVITHFKLEALGAQDRDQAAYMVRDLGYLIAAASRCLIQGIDECEPVTHTPNRDWLNEAIWRLLNSFDDAIRYYELDVEVMGKRLVRKMDHLIIWHAQAVKESG